MTTTAHEDQFGEATEKHIGLGASCTQARIKP